MMRFFAFDIAVVGWVERSTNRKGRAIVFASSCVYCAHEQSFLNDCKICLQLVKPNAFETFGQPKSIAFLNGYFA